MKKILFLTAIAVMFSAVTVFAADSATQTVSVSIEIPAVFVIDWAVSGATIDLTGANAITATEFDTGYKDAITGGTLECTANAAYDLTIVASAANFTGGSTTKPTSELQVKVDAGSYTSLNGTTAVTIINAQAAESNANKVLLYKILLNADDTAGTYATTLTYVIKADV